MTDRVDMTPDEVLADFLKEQRIEDYRPSLRDRFVAELILDLSKNEDLTRQRSREIRERVTNKFFKDKRRRAPSYRYLLRNNLIVEMYIEQRRYYFVTVNAVSWANNIIQKERLYRYKRRFRSHNDITKLIPRPLSLEEARKIYG
ncbi:MAG: hypothetical protein PXY39_14650 [archaeon]|nr:hypothetical protein [archaeon]